MAVIYLALVAAVIGLGFALALTIWILRQDEGSEQRGALPRGGKTRT